MVKNLPTVHMCVQSLGWEDAQQQKLTTHSSNLAGDIPWEEEPGGLQSLGLLSRTQLSTHAPYLALRELELRCGWPG